MKKTKIFLGGTCNGSLWRDQLIPLLTVDYFNPVVENWTPECQEEELKQRLECTNLLYVITPKMTGMYSIAEAVDDSNKRPEDTTFIVFKDDCGSVFTEHQFKSLKATAKLILANGGDIGIYDSLRNMPEFAKALNEGRIYV